MFLLRKTTGHLGARWTPSAHQFERQKSISKRGMEVALVVCKECGKEVSDQATNCVGCGAPLSVTTEKKLTCTVCSKKRNLRVFLVTDKDMELPKRTAGVATLLVVVGGAGLILNLFLGVAVIVAGIIVQTLGKKEVAIHRCPKCRTKFY